MNSISIKINKQTKKVCAKRVQLIVLVFPLFVEQSILWNPLWVFLKQTRGNNCPPPLPMRLLCLGVWSKTHCFWGVFKKCIEIEDIFSTTSARTQDLFLLLSDFSTNFHPLEMRAFFITSIVSLLVWFLGIEKT